MKILHFAFAAFLLFGSFGEASAQNLLINGDFDSGIEGWTHTIPTMTYWQANVDWAEGHSGALMFSANLSWGNDFGVWQCVNADAPMRVDFDAYMTSDPEANNILPALIANDAQNCAGDMLGYIGTIVVTQPGWYRTTMTNQSLPDNTSSVLVSFPLNLGAGKNFIDHVKFGPTDVLFASGFDVAL